MASNGSQGGWHNGMEIARHALGLLGTWLFSSGLFFLPLMAVFLLRVFEYVPTPESAAGDTGYGVAMFEASWGGGGGVEGDGGDEVLDGADAEAPSEEVVAGAEEGAPAAPAPSAGQASSGSRGSGGGRGGGTGTGTGSGTGGGSAVTMYRPGGGPDLSGMGGKAKCDPLVTGITSTGPDSFTIERTLVDEYANVKMAKTLIGGIERHQNELGEYDGVQIFGIPCGSPLQLAGLKNGDVIHDINGYEITGIPAGLLAWRKLRDDDVLEVNVTRRGKARKLVYTLV